MANPSCNNAPITRAASSHGAGRNRIQRQAEEASRDPAVRRIVAAAPVGDPLVLPHMHGSAYPEDFFVVVVQ
jgi:hypothetical protein